jgi:phosphate transport system protein
MRNKLDEQVSILNRGLLEMGSLIESAIQSANDALVNQNIQQAQKAIEIERRVDEKEREIENICLKILLQQQPVARDLRLVSAALKMITDMERISDQAADIAEIVILMDGKPYIKKLEHLPQMAQAAIRMVSGSIDAFITSDVQQACEVIKMDDVVDDLFDIIKNELIELIHKNPSVGEQAIDLLMIAKYFERIGDHAQNIAEWAVYSITGVHKGEIVV